MFGPKHDGDIELSEQSQGDVSRKPLISTTSEVINGRIRSDRVKDTVEDSAAVKLSVLSRAQLKYASDAWRLVVGSGALAGFGVLLVNLIAVIVVYARYEVVDGAAVVYEGSCSTSANTVLGLHIVINILSTILLACSNYSMQCLSSPSRSEVDAAHARRRWLSIGVPNVRNLFSISRSKVFLWLLLALSSFPLHLLWNSAAFETTTANNYVAVSVTEDFLHGASWISFHNTFDDSLHKLQSAARAVQLKRLENADCIRAYGQPMQHSRRDVLLVSETTNPVYVNDTSTSAFAVYNDPFMASGGTTFSWMCGAEAFSDAEDGYVWECDAPYLDSFAATSANRWIPGEPKYDGVTSYGDQQNLTVSYCLSEAVPEQCKVNLVPMILGVVIVCNVIKIAAFLATLWISQRKKPLITTGDAIQSFLERRDTLTKGRCLVSKEEYETIFRTSKEWKPRMPGTGDVWTGGRTRWGKSIRWYYWWIFMLPASTVIILAGAIYGPDGSGDGVTQTWPIIGTLGIGKPQTNFDLTIGSSVGLLTAVLTANSPQLIITYIYLFLNNLMTCMLTMAEWCTFASQPTQGLRVSSPHKNTEQRSTYFIQVPLRYGLPAMASITTLHWLVSQMVFMARIDVYDIHGNLTPTNMDLDSTGSITTVYFSPLAMIIAVPLASVLILLLIGFAIFARYPSHVPLAACCSASLGAACQPAEGESFQQDLPLKRLNWGVVDCGRGEIGVGHATFSSLPVGQLMKGRLYA